MDSALAAVAEMDVPAIQSWLHGERDGILRALADYVALESPSTDVALLTRCSEWLRGWLTDALGGPQRWRREDHGTYGETLVCDLAGASERRVTMLCHYDTVWPGGTVGERPFTVRGDVATGPGVFDMKAGLIQAVWALRALAATHGARPAVRLVLNGDEELGSPASRRVVEEACRGSAAVLVFEPSANGAVKTARKGVSIYHVAAHGVASHAGLDPAAGASAIAEIVHVAERVLALADTAAGTTINIGEIAGGTGTNVVAEHASIGVDVRASSVSEAARVDGAMHDLVAADPRVSLAVDGGTNRPVMERSPEIAGMYALVRAAGERMNLDLEEASVGGGSDGNFAAMLGLPVLDGLGAVGGGAHAVDEHVSVAGMTERAALAAVVVHALA